MTAARAPSLAARLAASVAVAAGLAVSAYAALRTVERALLPQPNPALVVWSERSSYLWRMGLSAWLGGLGLFAGWVLTRSDTEPGLRLATLLGLLGPLWLVALTLVAP